MDDPLVTSAAGQDAQTRQEAAHQIAAAILLRSGPDSPAAARLLSQSLPDLQDSVLAAGVVSALRQAATLPGGQAVLDAIWQSWKFFRHADLGALLVEIDQPASHPVALRILSALQLNQPEVIRSAGAPAVGPLLEACSDADPGIASRAAENLQNLPAPAAQAEVCRWVLEHDHPQARRAALAGGYAPQQPHERALFYLLTGQWENYERLDFDANLIEAVYAAGSEALRQQITQAARLSGWSGFIQAIAGGRSRRRLAELSEFEWEAVLLILSRTQRWQETWQLAQSAPTNWSARLLRSLNEADWSPSTEEERTTFERFTRLAEACLGSGPAVGLRIQHQAALYGHTRQITALVYLPHHGLAATASADRSLRLWDLQQGRIHKIIEGHTDFVLALAAAPNGSWLASGSADKTVRLWSLPDGAPLHTYGGHAGRVSQLAVQPDGSLIISGDERSVYFLNPESRSLANSLRYQFNGLAGLAITPDGSLLVTGDSDRSVRLWSLPDGEPKRSLLAPLVGWTLSPDGSSLASSSSYSAIQLWNLREGETLRTLPGRANNTLLSFSPDSLWLACADRSNVMVWDLQSDLPPQTLKGGAALTSSLAFSVDSQLLAAGNQDRTLRLFKLPDGELLKTLEGYTAPVRHLVFTADGRQLISTDEVSLQVWTLQDLAAIFNTPSSKLDPLALEALLHNPELTPAQHAWLEFSLALAHWQRRFDIEVSEPAPHIPVGDYDIEIEF